MPVKERGELAGIGQPPFCLHNLLLLPPLGRLPLILVYPVQDVLHHLVANDHPGMTQKGGQKMRKDLLTDFHPGDLLKVTVDHKYI